MRPWPRRDDRNPVASCGVRESRVSPHRGARLPAGVVAGDGPPGCGGWLRPRTAGATAGRRRDERACRAGLLVPPEGTPRRAARDAPDRRLRLRHQAPHRCPGVGRESLPRNGLPFPRLPPVRERETLRHRGRRAPQAVRQAEAVLSRTRPRSPGSGMSGLPRGGLRPRAVRPCRPASVGGSARRMAPGRRARRFLPCPGASASASCAEGRRKSAG